MPQMSDDLRRFVIENFLFGQEGDLSHDASFIETGVIDSTGVLELVGFLEQRFGIRIEDRELLPENLDSLRRVEAFVQRKLSEMRGHVAG